MELKDFKERLIKRKQGLNVTFTSAERTFLYGTYYKLTGRMADMSCSSCDSYTYKILLNHLNNEKSLEEQYYQKHGKKLPNRYKNDLEWIKSKL